MKKTLAVGDKVKVVGSLYQVASLISEFMHVPVPAKVVAIFDSSLEIETELRGIKLRGFISPRQVVSRIVKKRKHVIWVNEYEDFNERVYAYTNRDKADSAAHSDRIGGKAWRYVRARDQS